MIRLYGIAFRAMGSQFNVWLETDADGEAVLQQVPGWVETIEAHLSRFRPESELSRLNARSAKWVTVSDTLLQATLAARRAAWLSGGLCNPLILPALVAAGYERSFAEMQRDGLDVGSGSGLSSFSETQRDGLNGSGGRPGPTPVPDWRGITVKPKHHLIRLPAGSQLDLGGTGKGWTAQQIARRLAEYGPCVVDAGGDVVAHGKPQDQIGWLIDVSAPGQPDDAPPVASVLVSDAAVATSGIDYRRWMHNGQPQHHLIDPRTGQPTVSDVLAATVIHTDATLAEAYAKSLVILGADDGLNWLMQQPQRAALVVRTDGSVLATADFLSHQAAPV
jgi:thiamine biosynthesis lipoprotein